MAEYIERKRAIVDACNSLELYSFEYAKLEDALNKIPAADVVPVQKWISVKDRLPEPKENAICLNRHGDMMIGTYTEWGWMFPCYFEGPTHWMPLPHPLKGE